MVMIMAVTGPGPHTGSLPVCADSAGVLPADWHRDSDSDSDAALAVRSNHAMSTMMTPMVYAVTVTDPSHCDGQSPSGTRPGTVTA
jgi:hypothetical protein